MALVTAKKWEKMRDKARDTNDLKITRPPPFFSTKFRGNRWILTAAANVERCAENLIIWAQTASGVIDRYYGEN